MKRQPIYVEVPIYTDIDAIWDASQQPDRHEQWDLRFSSITYLPKKEGEPQAFVYSRTVGPFLQVEGWGKASVRSIKKMAHARLPFISERSNGFLPFEKVEVIGNMNHRKIM